jgi:adhesin HecA-like repeat protein
VADKSGFREDRRRQDLQRRRHGSLGQGPEHRAHAETSTNNGDVKAANGNLSYTTTGNFTNNGKLLAGQTLTVGGNNVDNTANAEMSGDTTVVNASGTLTNRGLIDSTGATQINAGSTEQHWNRAVSTATRFLSEQARSTTVPRLSMA